MQNEVSSNVYKGEIQAKKKGEEGKRKGEKGRKMKKIRK